MVQGNTLYPLWTRFWLSPDWTDDQAALHTPILKSGCLFCHMLTHAISDAVDEMSRDTCFLTIWHLDANRHSLLDTPNEVRSEA